MTNEAPNKCTQVMVTLVRLKKAAHQQAASFQQQLNTAQSKLKEAMHEVEVLPSCAAFCSDGKFIDLFVSK